MRYETPTYHRHDMSMENTQAGTSGLGSFVELMLKYAQFNTKMRGCLTDSIYEAFGSAGTRSPHSLGRECNDECRDPCYDDPCHCRCCIHDADLVIYSRLGEMRVVPFRIENQRKRKREISIHLSDWTTLDGKNAYIHSFIIPETDFTLEPCTEEEIILVVGSKLNYKLNDMTKSEMLQAAEAAEDSSARKPTVLMDREAKDVDDCLVLYADLQIEGCGVRPLRIALVLLPRDCFPYEISCWSSCC
jgi:hypothetical protein